MSPTLPGTETRVPWTSLRLVTGAGAAGAGVVLLLGAVLLLLEAAAVLAVAPPPPEELPLQPAAPSPRAAQQRREARVEVRFTRDITQPAVQPLSRWLAMQVGPHVKRNQR